jgi:hypothetical protein
MKKAGLKFYVHPGEPQLDLAKLNADLYKIWEDEHYKDCEPLKAKSKNIKYRIKKDDGTFLNAGTGENSWFTLDDARKLVDYSKGQIIVESDGMNELWEIF